MKSQLVERGRGLEEKREGINFSVSACLNEISLKQATHSVFLCVQDRAVASPSARSQGQAGRWHGALAWVGTGISVLSLPVASKSRCLTIAGLPAHPLRGTSDPWLLLLHRRDPAGAGAAAVLGVRSPPVPSTEEKSL